MFTNIGEKQAYILGSHGLWAHEAFINYILQVSMDIHIYISFTSPKIDVATTVYQNCARLSMCPLGLWIYFCYQHELDWEIKAPLLFHRLRSAICSCCKSAFFTGCPLVSKTMIDSQFKLLEFNHYWVQIHI